MAKLQTCLPEVHYCRKQEGNFSFKTWYPISAIGYLLLLQLPCKAVNVNKQYGRKKYSNSKKRYLRMQQKDESYVGRILNDPNVRHNNHQLTHLKRLQTRKQSSDTVNFDLESKPEQT